MHQLGIQKTVAIELCLCRQKSLLSIHLILFPNKMNYLRHLSVFFDRILLDDSLNPTHISLYIALFQFWNSNRFQNPISISRDEVMRMSKICSKATYHKCMRELNEKRYLKYEPSFNPYRGSMVVLFNFSEEHIQDQKRASKNEENRKTKITSK